MKATAKAYLPVRGSVLSYPGHGHLHGVPFIIFERDGLADRAGRRISVVGRRRAAHLPRAGCSVVDVPATAGAFGGQEHGTRDRQDGLPHRTPSLGMGQQLGGVTFHPIMIIRHRVPIRRCTPSECSRFQTGTGLPVDFLRVSDEARGREQRGLRPDEAGRGVAGRARRLLGAVAHVSPALRIVDLRRRNRAEP